MLVSEASSDSALKLLQSSQPYAKSGCASSGTMRAKVPHSGTKELMTERKEEQHAREKGVDKGVEDDRDAIRRNEGDNALSLGRVKPNVSIDRVFTVKAVFDVEGERRWNRGDGTGRDRDV